MAMWQSEILDALTTAATAAQLAATQAATAAATAASLLIRPAVAVTTSVSVTTVNKVLLPAEPTRRQVIIRNDTVGVLCVMLGPVATTELFSFQLGANSEYHSLVNGYTGAISAIRITGGTSVVLVTEIRD